MAAAAATERIPTRERRPSVGVPLVDIQGAVGPAGITRPKHKRTFTGFGAEEIKSVEGMLTTHFPGFQASILDIIMFRSVCQPAEKCHNLLPIYSFTKRSC
jgi:hypothetical protein